MSCIKFLSSIQYYLLSHKCHLSPEPTFLYSHQLDRNPHFKCIFQAIFLSGIFHFYSRGNTTAKGGCAASEGSSGPASKGIPHGQPHGIHLASTRVPREIHASSSRAPCEPLARPSRAPREHSREIHARTHASRSTQPYPSPPLLYRTSV